MTMTAALANRAPLTIDAFAAKECSFDYDFLSVADLAVQTSEHPKTGKKIVDRVMVKDEPLKPTDRFWVSLFSRYGFNSSFFKYFDHAEVFDRISKIESNDRMRLCIERDSDGAGTILGVSNPTKPIVVYDELMDMLTRYNGEGVMYHNGIVESTHTPRSGANQFYVMGDAHMNRFLLATPIDGYGAPNIYLSILRLICQNGTIGYAKAFRAGLSLGKADDDVGPSMTRALDGFNNDEGYAALRQRIEVSAASWCSVHESATLYKLLVKLAHQQNLGDFGGVTPAGAKKIAAYLNDAEGDDSVEGIGSPVLKAFHALTGDTSKIYGLANLDALSVKRQRTLPVNCKVYDAINFATEVATHYATPAGSRALNAWVGTLVTEEYDMENTADKFGDFADFHVTQKGLAGLTGSANSAQ